MLVHSNLKEEAEPIRRARLSLRFPAFGPAPVFSDLRIASPSVLGQSTITATIALSRPSSSEVTVTLVAFPPEVATVPPA